MIYKWNFLYNVIFALHLIGYNSHLSAVNKVNLKGLVKAECFLPRGIPQLKRLVLKRSVGIAMSLILLLEGFYIKMVSLRACSPY